MICRGVDCCCIFMMIWLVLCRFFYMCIKSFGWRMVMLLIVVMTLLMWMLLVVGFVFVDCLYSVRIRNFTKVLFCCCGVMGIFCKKCFGLLVRIVFKIMWLIILGMVLLVVVVVVEFKVGFFMVYLEVVQLLRFKINRIFVKKSCMITSFFGFGVVSRNRWFVDARIWECGDLLVCFVKVLVDFMVQIV